MRFCQVPISYQIKCLTITRITIAENEEECQNNTWLKLLQHFCESFMHSSYHTVARLTSAFSIQCLLLCSIFLLFYDENETSSKI